MMKQVAAIQMCSSPNPDENLAMAAQHIAIASQSGAELIVLPEVFACMGQRFGDMLAYQEDAGSGPLQTWLSTMASQHGVWLVGGTIPIKTDDPDRASAACLVYNPQGDCAARYDKRFLFDVTLSEEERFFESRYTVAGHDIVTVETSVGKLGLAVCYDLRFPKHFQALAAEGCDVIALPAAFLAKTGQAHWEVLLRARALDTQCYWVAANQCGEHASGRKTHGHSMIIDPWGKVLAEQFSEPGVISAPIDQAHQSYVRNALPIFADSSV